MTGVPPVVFQPPEPAQEPAVPARVDPRVHVPPGQDRAWAAEEAAVRELLASYGRHD